jgi:hypothetical protein
MGRKLYIYGLFVYAVLFILSLVFYKERIALLDDALYLFDIIQKGSFSIQHFRFISVVTEIFPLLASKLSVPLNGVMMAYSGGFIIYYFICYLLCGWMKEYRFGIAILLVNILFSTHTFYWMLSELTLGIAMLAVLLAFMNSRKLYSNKLVTAVVLLVLMPTIAFAHMLVMIPLTFGLAFMCLQNRNTMSIRKVALVLGLYIACLVVKSVFFKEGYDSQAMDGLKNFKVLFPDYFNIHSNRVFLKNCLLKYQWIPIVSMGTTVVYIQTKQWQKLLLYLCYVLGFIALVNISYPNELTQEFYIENLYLPLGFLLALPLVYDVLPILATKRYAKPVVAFFFITCLLRIYGGHDFYTDRLNWMRAFMKEHSDEKLVVNDRYLPMDKLLMTFGSPYEFWLLSTTELGKTASIVLTKNMGEVEWGTKMPNGFLVTWGLFPYGELSKQYFHFTDSVSVYRVIK